MKLTSFTTIAALILIGAGGFMAGRISSPSSGDGSKEDRSGKSARVSSSASDDSSGGSARKSQRSDRSERVTRGNFKSSKDRLAKLEEIVRGENPLDRNRALLAFIDQLGPGDFEEAIAHFRSLGLTEERFGEYAMLLSAWAKQDPLAALTYAKENTRTRFATGTILATWAAIDPDAAIRWAEANHDGDGANPYLAGIIRSLAASDPVRATQLLTSMPKSVERGEALDSLLPHLLTRGGDATRAWIADLKDESLKNGAMMRVAEQLADTDPAGTAAWLIANPGDATLRRVDDVYSIWAQKDQRAAITSLTAMPPGENRSNALRGVISSIAMEDPKAAVSMMDRFSNDVTDRVVQNFIWHSFGNDPQTAVSQIARITDEHDRDRMYGRTLEAWLEDDNAAATAWMQRNPVPASVLERLNRNQQQR